MKHAVVTGATGFIAVHLIDKLIHDEYRVDAIVRPSSIHLNRLAKHERLNIIELDMKEIVHLKERLEGDVDEFYHLAWEGARSPQNENPALQEANFIASIDALNLAIQLGCTSFIATGSQAEYGLTHREIKETTQPNPITEYGKAKLRVAGSGAKLAENKIRFIWARVFSVYGVNDHPDTLIQTCLRKMLKDEEIFLGPCTQDWNYMVVDDAAEALKRLGTSDCPSGVYNVASGDTRPLKEFVLALKEITRSKSVLHFGSSDKDQVNLKPNIEKMHMALRWMPETSFEEGIERMIHSIKEAQI